MKHNEYCRYCGSDEYEYLISTLCCKGTVCNRCTVQFMLTSTVPMCRICQDIWYDNDLNIQLDTVDYLDVVQHKNAAALSMDQYYRQLWNTFVRLYNDEILSRLIEKYSLDAVPTNVVELRQYLYDVGEQLDEAEIRTAANTLTDMLYEFSFEDKQTYQICTDREPDSWTVDSCNSNKQYIDLMYKILEEVGIDSKRCANCDYVLLRDKAWDYVNCRACVSLMRWDDELMVYSCGKKTYNVHPRTVNVWRF